MRARRSTAMLGFLVLGACAGGETSTPVSSEDVAALSAIDVTAGAEELGDCTDVGGPVDEERDHVDPDTAPPADTIYAEHDERPAHSGTHFGIWQLPNDTDGDGLGDFDERALVHNLEHGSVVVAIDTSHPDAPDGAGVAAWAQSLIDAGFDSGNAGGGVYAVTYSDIPSGSPVAYRAWGVALDCEAFSVDAASAFVAQHYGTNGNAPEKTLSPYPDDVLTDTSPQAR